MITFSFILIILLQATIVHTAETHRLRFFLDMLLATRRPVMLVGAAGTGKTVLMNNKLKSLPPADYLVANVPFNFYTTSEMLQNILEKPLEKKAGRNYGPPGTKKLIYFVDDMNMPEVWYNILVVMSFNFLSRIIFHVLTELVTLFIFSPYDQMIQF